MSSDEQLITAINNLETELADIRKAVESLAAQDAVNVHNTPSSGDGHENGADDDSTDPAASDGPSVSSKDRADVMTVLAELDEADGGTGWSEHVTPVTNSAGDAGPRIVLDDAYKDMSDAQQEAWREISGPDGPDWITVTEWGETDDGGSFPAERAVLADDLGDMREEVLPVAP